MWKLIWCNIIRRRNQSLLTMAITGLTVLTFVVMLGVFTTMNQGLKLSQERLGADAVILPEEASTDGYELLFTANPENVYMPASILDSITALDDVAAASPQFYAQTLSGGCCDFGPEMRVVGFDQDTDFILQPYFKLQEFDRLQDDQIILGGNFTDYVGFPYRILGQRFLVVGELFPTGTGMDNTIFMNIDVARRISKESENLNQVLGGKWEDEDPMDQISAVMVKLKEGVDPEAFAWYIKMESGLNVQCVLPGETISSMQDQLLITLRILLSLWLALLLVAVLSLVGRFNALAKDRKKEIGLLRAIGVGKGEVFGLIVGEACVMAAIGGLFGSVIGCIFMDPMIEAATQAFSMTSSQWDLTSALLCGVCGLLMACVLGFAASVWPALKSASLEPQAAITQGELN